MKDGKTIGMIALLAVGAYALSKARPAGITPTYALNFLPAEKRPQPVQTTIETYAGAPGEIAPVVKTVADFSATYGMSEKAAIETALSYAANPTSSDFAELTTRDKQNLANIAAEAQAPKPASTDEAEAQVTAVIGSQPTASVQELDIVAQTYGRESEAYEAVIDTAYEAAAVEAESTGGVVAWSSEEGYHTISQEEAASPEYREDWY